MKLNKILFNLALYIFCFTLGIIAAGILNIYQINTNNNISSYNKYLLEYENIINIYKEKYGELYGDESGE